MSRVHRAARGRSRVAAAILAGVLCLAGNAVAVSPAQAAMPQDALIGRWQGSSGIAPTETTLTLYGDLQRGSGTYEIGTLVHSEGSIASFQTPWSGHWVRLTETVDGKPQTEIRLEGALNDEIDRYFLEPSGVLEPTPDLVGRPLTRQEIAEYSLSPVRAGG